MPLGECRVPSAEDRARRVEGVSGEELLATARQETRLTSRGLIRQATTGAEARSSLQFAFVASQIIEQFVEERPWAYECSL